LYFFEALSLYLVALFAEVVCIPSLRWARDSAFVGLCPVGLKPFFIFLVGKLYLDFGALIGSVQIW
jgi:hypothetical protein